MRVLEVLASGAVGGGSTHLRDLAQGLDPGRFAPVVACSDDGPLAAHLEAAGHPVVRIPMTSRLNPRAIAAIAERARREKVALIHSHGTRAALCGAPAAALCGVPHLYTVHGWSFHQRGSALAETAARSCEAVASRLSRQVVCVSHADQRSGLAHGILSPQRSRVIPNGIDPARFRPDPAARARMREALGVAEGEPLIGLFGRLTRQKAQGVFLRAAAEVLAREPATRFMLVGDGEDRVALAALSAGLGLGGRLLMLGSRSDVPALLAATDVFVLPSLWEGLPIALLEAMACGVPVIASAVDGSLEVVQPGLSGLLVPPGEVAPLAEAILALIRTPALAARLAAAGRERVLALYPLSRMIAAIEALYAEVAAPRSGTIA
ncbi:glycosyltransferase [bacterium]|nr:glycosyltransferase [bacterium]